MNRVDDHDHEYPELPEVSEHVTYIDDAGKEHIATVLRVVQPRRHTHARRPTPHAHPGFVDLKYFDGQRERQEICVHAAGTPHAKTGAPIETHCFRRLPRPPVARRATPAPPAADR